MTHSELEPSEATQLSGAVERPWIYGLLIAPSAVVANGVVQGGVLAFLLGKQGMDSNAQARLIEYLALPTMLYFLWCPITDFLMKRRSWLLTGGLVAAAFMAWAFHQKTLTSAGSVTLMLLSACCSQLVVSSCGGMMGTMRSVLARRSAGSFYQAGSLGFGALAAWALVWLSSRVSRDVLGLTAAAMIGIPALFALLAPAQETVATGSFGPTMKRVWMEFKATFFRREAIPYAACMVFPMGSGAAIGLLTDAAKYYGVSGDGVAWVNGLLGGVLMAAGAGVMTLVRVRARATVLYMVVSLVNCVPLFLLWLAPLRPATYYTGIVLYLFTIGSAYAMFTAVVLEFLGDSAKSGSTRYSLINSLGNVPVLYMLRVDGWGGKLLLGRGVAAAEAVVGGIGGALLLVYLLINPPSGRGKAL